MAEEGSSSSSSKSRRSRSNTDLTLGPSEKKSKSKSKSDSSDDSDEIPDENAGGLVVNVYMEGSPVIKKIDLLAQNGYQSLIRTLEQKFETTTIYLDRFYLPSPTSNVLIYEDHEGDWMMIGDSPWGYFLANVKKLKITTADKLTKKRRF